MVVIVLGHRLQSSEIHDQLKGRMDTGISYFKETNSDWLIVSGAATNPDVSKAECDVMYEYAVNQGVDPSNILRERNAKDTVGNGYFSRRLIDQLDIDSSTIHVVSSCYHMERSKYIFEYCFGPAYTIDTSHCHEYRDTPESSRERQKMDQVEELLGDISPGEIDVIQDRLVESHDLYNITEV